LFDGALDLADFDYKKLRAQQYLACMAFRARRDIDMDLRLVLLGRVDPVHSALIPPQQQQYYNQGGVMEFWDSLPRAWKAGDVVLKTMLLDAPDVPVNYTLRLIAKSNADAGLGWWAAFDAKEAAQWNGRIERADGIGALGMILQEAGHGGSIPDVAAPFQKKLEQLLSRESTQTWWTGSFDSVGLDLLAFDYRMLQSGKYLVSAVFRARQAIDAELRLGLAARVEEMHKALIAPEEKEHYAQTGTIDFWDSLPSAWKPGDVVLKVLMVNVPDVPVEINLVVKEAKERKEGAVRLGWLADLDNLR